MVNTEKFNNSICDIIDMHSYDIYVINRYNDIKCTCITHETAQADPKCKRCLGTGRKIRIIKTKGASQDTKLPPTFRSDNFIVARNFFIKTSNAFVKENDLIVDKENVYVAYENQEMTSLEGSLPYVKISTGKKKFDSKIFLKNFREIINGGKKK